MLQAAWAILLGRMTGRDDVVFGVTVAGRPPEIAGIESMVGLFINTLPLRVKLPPGKPLCDLLKEIAGQPVATDRAPASWPCRDPGSRRAGRAVRHPHRVRELSGRAQQRRDRSAGPAAEPRSAGAMRRIILSLWWSCRASSCTLRLDYQADLFDRSSVEALASRLVRLLEAAVAAPERAIGRLEILAASERLRILEEWNATARAVPAGDAAGAVRGAGGARRRTAIAAVYEDRELSYAALDAHANRLAHHLRGARGRAGDGGGALGRSLAGDGDRAARHPQGGRRPICRSTRRIRRSGCRSCWRTPAARCW